MSNVYENQTLEFQLKSGRKVVLKAFRLDLTYGNMIEGDPDPFVNKMVFERIGRPDGFREMATHVIMPLEEEIKDILPPFYCTVQLKSYEGIQRKGAGSEMILVFFVEDVINKSIGQLIQEGIEDLDWDSHAHEFDWSDF